MQNRQDADGVEDSHEVLSQEVPENRTSRNDLLDAAVQEQFLTTPCVYMVKRVQANDEHGGGSTGGRLRASSETADRAGAEQVWQGASGTTVALRDTSQGIAERLRGAMHR